MKGCLKIILFAFLGLVVLGGLLAIFELKNDKTKSTKTEEVTSKADTSNNEPSSTDELKKEIHFDLNKSQTFADLLVDFDSCYHWAIAMKPKDGVGLEIAKRQGSIYYNNAYQKYLELQREANDNLSGGKSEVINKALKFYFEIFNNKYGSVSNYTIELNFINENLKEFQNRESQIEKDYKEGAARYFINSGDKVEIGLPRKGNWCLTNIEGGESVLLTGDFPNNGYGTYDIANSQLPINVGYNPTMLVDNVGIRTNNLQLIFKRCERVK